MGVLDKFLDMMNLDNEDDFDDDDFYEDDDYYEEKAPKRKASKAAPEPDDEPVSRRSDSRARTSSKVTPMRQSRRAVGSAGLEVRVIRPTSVEDSRDIAETLLQNRTVVLNLEGLDLEIAQRIIDFTSGTCFALDGNLQKISQYIFLLTPSNVDISGDLTDILNGSFDVPSVRAGF